jgi:hypothetical protein
METLFKDSSFADFTITAPKYGPTAATMNSMATRTRKRKHGKEEAASRPDTRSIAVHKCILAARSPVFRAMFQSGMSETENSEVLIQDFDAAVMQEFVRFLYTNRCDKAALEQHAEQLLAAACKYQVPGLKCLCQEELVETVNMENSLARLEFANLHGLKELRTRSLEIIAKNAKDLARESAFVQQALAAGGTVSAQVMKALAGVEESSDDDDEEESEEGVESEEDGENDGEDDREEER